MQEFQQSTAQVVAAAVKGVKDGAGLPDSGSGDFLEKLIAAFSTDKGSNLLTLAIGVACKSSTNAWCEHQSRQDAASAAAGQPDNLQRLFNFASAPATKPPRLLNNGSYNSNTVLRPDLSNQSFTPS